MTTAGKEKKQRMRRRGRKKAAPPFIQVIRAKLHTNTMFWLLINTIRKSGAWDQLGRSGILLGAAELQIHSMAKDSRQTRGEA